MKNYLEEESESAATEVTVKKEKKSTTLHMGKVRAKFGEDDETIVENEELMEWLVAHRKYLEDNETDKAAYSVLHHMFRDAKKTFENGQEFFSWYKQARPKKLKDGTISWRAMPEKVTT